MYYDQPHPKRIARREQTATTENPVSGGRAAPRRAARRLGPGAAAAERNRVERQREAEAPVRNTQGPGVVFGSPAFGSILLFPAGECPTD